LICRIISNLFWGFNFLVSGDRRSPSLYFSEAEERFVFMHQAWCIQGDPRSYLKSLERDKMIDIWKQRAPRQVEFFKAFPQQVLRQARLVWKWAIEKGDGEAWLYFIFGVCQWLPTRYRLGKQGSKDVKNDKKEKKEMKEKNLQDPQWQKCLLCQSYLIEDMPHLWVCPATAKEQVILQLQADKFIQDSLLFSDNKMEPRQFRLRRNMAVSRPIASSIQRSTPNYRD